MNDYYIIIGLSSTEHSVTYISNTSPILWSNVCEDAKKFISYNLAKSELEDNFISLSATISYTYINSIYICEYRNNVEIGRERFL